MLARGWILSSAESTTSDFEMPVAGEATRPRSLSRLTVRVTVAKVTVVVTVDIPP